MALSRALLRTRFKTHIRAELAVPAVNDINDASIDEFANENTATVIDILTDSRLPDEVRNTRASEHFPSLLAVDTALVFTLGAATLPASYCKALAVKAATTTPTIAKRFCRLMTTSDDFSRWDSSNFIYTPDMERPIAFIADKVYIKPSTITAGFIDYIKTHTTIDGSNGTLFSPLGDAILIDLMLADYYTFIEEFELAALHTKNAEAYRGVK